MGQNKDQATTFGILYAGELGSALGRILLQGGLRVVTTLEGRGTRTAQACLAAGLEVLDSLKGVALTAEVILSVVPPAAAQEVAKRFAGCFPHDGQRPLYADLNSIAPATARTVAGVLGQAGIEFVDGAVHGLASRLPERGTVYLSGHGASRLADLLGKSLPVRVLGPEPGTASAFKMLLGGVSKGVNALFLEMSLAAQGAGLLDDFLACCRDIYPGILDMVDRILPSYPRHAARRGDEMRQLCQMLRGMGRRPCLPRGAQELLDEMGRLRLDDEDRRPWTVAELVKELANGGLLRLPSVQANAEKRG
jgi:3-hydroxyisobutyrate dehydrogenase-like beta-hydroxyacid dehydrogenase